MKNFLSKLFHRDEQVINFQRTTKTIVQVLDSEDKGPKRKKLFYGFVSSINFTKRELTINEDSYEHVLPFDKIVTLSRMEDGRIRVWIKVEGEE